jgi:hypothetical protein
MGLVFAVVGLSLALIPLSLMPLGGLAAAVGAIVGLLMAVIAFV